MTTMDVLRNVLSVSALVILTMGLLAVKNYLKTLFLP